MNWTNDTCPITNEPIEEALPRMADNAEMICKTCGRFRITGSASEAARHHPPEVRFAALEAAKSRAAVDNSIPQIHSSDFP